MSVNALLSEYPSSYISDMAVWAVRNRSFSNMWSFSFGGWCGRRWNWHQPGSSKNIQACFHSPNDQEDSEKANAAAYCHGEHRQEHHSQQPQDPGKHTTYSEYDGSDEWSWRLRRRWHSWRPFLPSWRPFLRRRSFHDPINQPPTNTDNADRWDRLNYHQQPTRGIGAVH
jgi:hypothetical protein